MTASPVRPGKPRSFSWLDPRPLWHSRNDRIARYSKQDPVLEMRREWLKSMPADPGRTKQVAAADQSISFLVLGDTGEGDGSQFALVPPLLAQAPGTAFMYVCSDVIYPAGGIDEYRFNFFKPYRDYLGPIFAIPGNHDWYDNCSGFMYWFCGAEHAPRPSGFVRRLVWRKPPRADQQVIAECRALRGHTVQHTRQPGPYFALDAGPVRLVGIDTGITNQIDADQGKWLARVSRGDKPKILMTGKPLYVDGEPRRCKIEGGGSVNEIVSNPDHNYIAAIGGDIHNYQRYPVDAGDGRTLMCLVSGGGGAFMHGTHTIPKIDPKIGVSEADFRCYPLRGDSLSRFSQLYAKKLWGRLRYRAKFIPPNQAAAVIGAELGITPTRDEAKNIHVPPRMRETALRLMERLPDRKRGALHVPYAEWLDANDPPLFKHFLKIDATPDSVRIRCFGVTGCEGEEGVQRPPEDDLLAERQANGTWHWSWPKA